MAILRKSSFLDYIVFVLSCVSIVSLTSCGTRTEEARPAESMRVIRMDEAVAQYRMRDTVYRDSVRSVYAKPLAFLFSVTGRGEVSDSSLYEYSCSRPVDVFTHLVDSLLPDIGAVEPVLGEVNARIRRLLPKAGIGALYAIVSPYNQSIFTTDSIMLVGLNHYLGADFEGYKYFEPYQRVNKRIDQLQYDVAEAAVGSAYPMSTDADATVLSHLLYQGALIEAKMQLVPDADLADALGYTAEQLEWMDANEAQAWDALITRNLLYSQSVTDAGRLILPSPSTTILHPDSPGRAGRYIGYRIVQAYLDSNPDAALSDLLSPSFYAGQQTLLNARYAPAVK